MSRRRLERAIILAAGSGSRLARADTPPKPLRAVSGVPLLVRILRTMLAEGLRDVVVVTGFEAERLEGELVARCPGGMSLRFVRNPSWERSNGLSVLAARAFLDRDCVLSMADHLVAPELLRRVLRAELAPGACALGVDFDVERCFDLDDATKVRVRGTDIVAIGKDLGEYNAIDTGIFRAGPALVEALDAVAKDRGDASLSDGVRALAARGRFHAVDVGDARWIDVDTPEAHARAEAMLRVFGDTLDDDDGERTGPVDPESLEQYTPTWVRGAPAYREDHFVLADRPRARPIARMMSNESPFPPSEAVVRAVVAALTRGHRYPDATLAQELRTRLTRDLSLDPGCCVLGAGSSEVIDLLVRTFVAPGEEVVVAVPTFSMYESRTRVAGGVPVLVPMDEDLSLDVPAVLGAITERTKLVFLCSPNNPTGRRLDDLALRRILRLGLPTVVDEAYVEFGDDDRSVAPLVREHPNLVVVRTFSKAFGLAGLRLGYALACEAMTRLLNRVKLPWNVSTPALAAALAVLDELPEQSRQRDFVRAERRWLAAELARLPGVTVFASDGNFLLLDVHETGLSADAVVQAALQEAVLLRSLASHHLRRGHVRVSIGTHADNRRCADVLRRVLDRSERRPQPPAG
ncbi:MAG: histidinol-phosphate transaminase [Deltaproteobacteria bacterium]|nr:histidinol-phosphate transaminase [Deltaproteobacteria bacterium]